MDRLTSGFDLIYYIPRLRLLCTTKHLNTTVPRTCGAAHSLRRRVGGTHDPGPSLDQNENNTFAASGVDKQAARSGQ